MQKKQFKDKYPIFYKDIQKSACSLKTVTQFLDYFQDKIESHERAVFIARFDHYTHTKSLDGDINANILDAQNIIMCFGWEIPSADPVAVRPRTIGITEMADKFVVNFMEAPNPIAQQIMVDWVEGIK